MKKIFQESLRTLLIIAGLFGVVALVSAWTAPTAAPPGDNVAAPLNVGTAQQDLQGSKTIGGGTTNVLSLSNIGLGVGGVLRGYSNAIFDGSIGIGNILTSGSPQGKLEVAGGGVIIGRPDGLNKGSGSLNAENVCIQGNCQSSWPSGGAINPVYKGDYTYGDNSLGNYTFCALTNINIYNYLGNNPNYTNARFNCWLRKEGNDWKLKVIYTGTYPSSGMLCGATCF